MKHAKKLDANFERSPYLDNIKSNKLKRIICSLRIGYNNLGYSVKNIVKTCPNCGHNMETIEHVILHCKEYEKGRKPLIDQLKKENHYEEFIALEDNDKIQYILDFSQKTFMRKVVKEICILLTHIDNNRKI